VLDDLIEVAGAFSDAIRTRDSEFAIPTRRGGQWRGQLSPDGSLLSVRTYV
jgi:hypothetical protein